MKNLSRIFVVGLGWWLALSTAQQGFAQVQEAVRRPAAKSQQEHDDYQTARRSSGGAALEKAASDFAQKYPESELRRYLFSEALRQYQIENNAAGMLAMGERVLAIDPRDASALVLSATVMADGLSPDDVDRGRKVTKIKEYAARAFEALDTGRPSSSQAALYRTTLKSMAYSALGIMELKTGNDAGAEKDLKAAADLPKLKPDPYVWYHLALAQDHRKKYHAALDSVEQALQLASRNPRLQQLAEAEHEHLNGLTRHAKEAQPSGGNQHPE